MLDSPSAPATDFAAMVEQSKRFFTDRFKDKPVFLSVFLSLISEYESLYDVMAQFNSEFTIDDATGDMLDKIGKLNGQDRLLYSFIDLPFFGFDGSINGQTYGTLSDPDVGGIYRSKFDTLSKSFFVTDDNDYRKIIKLRQMSSKSDTTYNSVCALISFAVSDKPFTVTKDDSNFVVIELEEELTELEEYLLKTIMWVDSFTPIPVGVRVILKLIKDGDVVIYIRDEDVSQYASF